ncbi:MAG: hypothetical protein M1818_006259 [Claussenomyces sp. TS43310]|nr:MAG: hypothetical protein M1818_006259 [Claussenomyces sp. TS43310]
MNSSSLRTPDHGKGPDLLSTGGGLSTIRPRNRRLVSTETELISGDGQGGSQRSTIPRGASPIPSRHPSRIASELGKGHARNGSPVGGLVTPGERSGLASPTMAFGKGFWEGGWTGSWTTLQGLASSVLSGEVNGGGSTSPNGANASKRRGRDGSSSKKSPATWGPSGNLPQKSENSVGSGSLSARDAALKARKTASVLESHERVNGGLDVSGRYKRRTSLEEPNQRGEDEEVMVYVHHVQPKDTLAGVVLKYNCQPAVFRKANRLWPNDIIQIRKVVLLPVDACTVKGRPCNAPAEGIEGVDLLAPTPNMEFPPQTTRHEYEEPWGNQIHNSAQATTSSPFDLMPAQLSKIDAEEQPWTHVRWVLIDTSPNSKPVEIARTSRKSLGYFPPRRRKSQTTISSVSTPRGSSEVPALPTLSTDSHPSSPVRRTSNLGSKPTTGSYFPASSSNISSRRESISDTAGRANWMRGPGGVGTFAKNVRKPGPGQDGLNSWAAKYLPGLSTESLPSTFVSGGTTASLGFSDKSSGMEEQAFESGLTGAATPAGQGLGLEHAAAAIEGWVRKLAVKGPGTPRIGTSGTGTSAMGDLIELLDGSGSDDGRGFEPPSATNVTSNPSGNARQDLFANIRSRAGQAGGKGKKSE